MEESMAVQLHELREEQRRLEQLLGHTALGASCETSNNHDDPDSRAPALAQYRCVRELSAHESNSAAPAGAPANANASSKAKADAASSPLADGRAQWSYQERLKELEALKKKYHVFAQASMNQYFNAVGDFQGYKERRESRMRHVQPFTFVTREVVKPPRMREQRAESDRRAREAAAEDRRRHPLKAKPVPPSTFMNKYELMVEEWCQRKAAIELMSRERARQAREDAEYVRLSAQSLRKTREEVMGAVYGPDGTPITRGELRRRAQSADARGCGGGGVHHVNEVPVEVKMQLWPALSDHERVRKERILYRAAMRKLEVDEEVRQTLPLLTSPTPGRCYDAAAGVTGANAVLLLAAGGGGGSCYGVGQAIYPSAPASTVPGSQGAAAPTALAASAGVGAGAGLVPPQVSPPLSAGAVVPAASTLPPPPPSLSSMPAPVATPLPPPAAVSVPPPPPACLPTAAGSAAVPLALPPPGVALASTSPAPNHSLSLLSTSNASTPPPLGIGAASATSAVPLPVPASSVAPPPPPAGVSALPSPTPLLSLAPSSVVSPASPLPPSGRPAEQPPLPPPPPSAVPPPPASSSPPVAATATSANVMSPPAASATAPPSSSVVTAPPNSVPPPLPAPSPSTTTTAAASNTLQVPATAAAAGAAIPTADAGAPSVVTAAPNTAAVSAGSALKAANAAVAATGPAIASAQDDREAIWRRYHPQLTFKPNVKPGVPNFEALWAKHTSELAEKKKAHPTTTPKPFDLTPSARAEKVVGRRPTRSVTTLTSAVRPRSTSRLAKNASSPLAGTLTGASAAPRSPSPPSCNDTRGPHTLPSSAPRGTRAHALRTEAIYSTYVKQSEEQNKTTEADERYWTAVAQRQREVRQRLGAYLSDHHVEHELTIQAKVRALRASMRESEKAAEERLAEMRRRVAEMPPVFAEPVHLHEESKARVEAEQSILQSLKDTGLDGATIKNILATSAVGGETEETTAAAAAAAAEGGAEATAAPVVSVPSAGGDDVGARDSSANAQGKSAKAGARGSSSSSSSSSSGSDFESDSDSSSSSSSSDSATGKDAKRTGSSAPGRTSSLSASSAASVPVPKPVPSNKEAEYSDDSFEASSDSD